MTTKKKRLEWTGKFRDQHAGKYRVWWSSGRWTLSYAGERISRHSSKEQAKRKAAQRPRPKKLTSTAKRAAKAGTITKVKAVLDHVLAQKRHDIAASVARHSSLPPTPLAGGIPFTVDPGVKNALNALSQPDSWNGDLDAIEYEHTRSADPDPRDNEDQEITCLILTARSELAEECDKVGVKAVLAARDSQQPRWANLFRTGIDSDGEYTTDGERW